MFHKDVPQPCDECYSIESFWRRISYEPNSQQPASVVVLDVADAREKIARALCEQAGHPWALAPAGSIYHARADAVLAALAAPEPPQEEER